MLKDIGFTDFKEMKAVKTIQRVSDKIAVCLGCIMLCDVSSPPPSPQETERFGMGPQILKKFYSCTIENILTGRITAWYVNCSALDRKALQRVVRMAQYITGAKLPAIQVLYTTRCQRKATNIVKDSSHTSHKLFSLLPHSKRYRSAKSRSKRLRFYPQSIRLLIN